MGVVHHLQIAPKERRTVPPGAIRDFIYSLIEGGHIEPEYTIWSGETEVIKEIDHYRFHDWTALSEAKALSGLTRVPESDLCDIGASKNYAFKIHISRESEWFRDLDVFTLTDFQHFPVFILYFDPPVTYTICRDYWPEETYIDERVELPDTNCAIVTSGRNLESSYGLDKEKDYAGFYDHVRGLFGDYEIGVYY